MMDHNIEILKAIERLETKMDNFTQFIEQQNKFNKLFFDVRDQVLANQAGKKAVIWVLGAFGTLTVAVSAVVSAVVAILFHGRVQ